MDVGQNLTLREGKVHLECQGCGQKNAVLVNKILDRPVCGRCQADLAGVGKPIDLSDAEFEQLIRDSPIPVMVDFWSPMCGPCRLLGPVLDQLAEQQLGRVLVAKINTIEHNRVAARFGVQGIPTVIVFDKGQEYRRQVGLVPMPTLLSLLPA